MTRAEQIRRARELRAQGLSFTAIGEALGRSYKWVRSHTHDVPLPERECRWCGESYRPTDPRAQYCSDRCRKAFCDDEHRAACVDCGVKLSAGSSWRGQGRCAPCHRHQEDERLDSRRRQIEQWWAGGLSRKQIASLLGWSDGHLSVELHQMRERGYSLPYRRRFSKPRFPDQATTP